jgi:acylphosphatase
VGGSKERGKVDRVARRYFVRGNVQGVGYRAFAVMAGKSAGVDGWTRNLDDGRVEVYAVGDPVRLSNLEGQLRMGPRWADVRGVEASEDVVDAKIRGFQIRY